MRTSSLSSLALIGLSMLGLAATAARAGSVTIDDLKKNDGTVYVLVGRQTSSGSDATLATSGVYMFRRSVQGNDASYYRVKLGSEADPYATTGSADLTMTPAFPVGTGKSLGVDKFLRVYLQDVNADSTQHDVATEAAAALPGGSTKTWNGHVDVHVPEQAWEGAFTNSVVTTYDHGSPYDMTGLAEIKPDGTIDYPGAALWSDEELSMTGFQQGFWAYSTGGSFSQQFKHWKFNRLAGAHYVPPDQGMLVPLSLTIWHPGSAFSKWTGPIPAGESIIDSTGTPVAPTPAPVGTAYITDIPSWDTRASPAYRAGYEYRKWDSASFSRDIYFLDQYADNQTASLINVSPGKCQAGDAVFSSVSWSAAYERTNSCADFCISGSSSGSLSGQTADAKVVFSSFGQELNNQRMYVALKTGGASSLVQFTLSGTDPCSGATWNRTDITPTSNFLVKYTGTTTAADFQTVGISSRTTDTEYFYLSNLPGNQFTVSSNLFLQGGVVWQLRPAATQGGDDYVDWEERVESDTVTNVPDASLSGSLDVGPDVQAIAADGSSNIYFTRVANDPLDSNLPTGLYGGTTGAAILTSANPYFVSAVPVPPPGQGTFYDTQVTFKQNVGYSLHKSGRFDPSPTQIGFVPLGQNYYSAYWDSTKNTFATPPTAAQLIPPSATVDNRVEVAAVNVSFPPPTDAVNVVDILYRGNTITGTPVKPDADQSINIVEDFNNNSTSQPDCYFDVENPPQFGGIDRINKSVFPNTPIGYSNLAPSVNQDNDAVLGKFSSSVIWGADVSDTTKDFQYKWEIRNMTFAGAANDDPSKGIIASLVNPDGSAGPALVSGSNGLAMASYVTPVRSPTTPSGSTTANVQFPLLKARFINPGRYRARLYVQGYYWDMQLGPLGLDGNISFIARGFGDQASPPNPMYGDQIINVKAAEPPPKTQFVYNVKILGTGLDPAANPPSNSLVTINERDTNNPAKIYADALVSWYQSDHYDDSGNPMAKTSGVGVWAYDDDSTGNYCWSVNPPATPPNWPSAAPTPGNHPYDYNRKNKNDGDGTAGTMYHYTANASDMLSSDPTSQQAHDWWGIKYEWIGEFIDPTQYETPGLTFDPVAGPIHPVVVSLKKGNLAELVTLQNMGVTTLLPGGLALMEQVTTAPNPAGMTFSRVFRVRVPLLDPNQTNLSNFTTTPGPDANPNNSFWGKPIASGTRTAVAPTWWVPTQPVPVKLTCKFYYPWVTWVPHADPNSTSTPPAPLKDDQGNVLYWDLVDATSHQSNFTGTNPGDPGQFYKGNGTAPVFTYTDPTGSDSDDFLELIVQDKTPPNLVSTPPTLQGPTGGIASADVPLQFKDNNPYLHFNSYNTIKSDIIWPKMAALFYEFGKEADPSSNPPGRDSLGVGVVNAAYHGFDLSAWPLPSLDFASEPGTGGSDNYQGPRPTAASFKYTNPTAPRSVGSANLSTWTNNPSHPTQWTVLGHDWTDSEITGMQQGSGASSMWTNPPSLWWSAASIPANARMTTYQLPGASVALPIFHDTSTNTNLNVYAQVYDGIPGNAVIPTKAADAKVDNSHSVPHVRVMVLNEKTQEAIYYVVENDWTWDTPTTGITTFRTVVKKEADPRAQFATGHGPSYTDTVQPAQGAFPSGSLSGWDFDFSTLASGAGTFEVEQDVRIQVRAWVTDNLVVTPSVQIARLNNVPFDEQTPQLNETATAASQRVTMMARQTYPKQGDSDTIYVTAGAGTRNVQLAIPIKVVNFAPDFRQIGDDSKAK